MAAPRPEATPPETTHEPPDALTSVALARKNIAWGWALFGLFLVLFGGTFGIAFVYLWLS
jgi:hypothetical protein